MTRKIRRFFRNIDICVIRVSGNGLNMSKPCNDCLSKMKLVGINRIYYSEDKYYITEEKIKEMTTEHLSLSAKLNFVKIYYK